MGKGDRKSKRGKIWRGTKGKRHQDNTKKAKIIIEAPPEKTKTKARAKAKPASK